MVSALPGWRSSDPGSDVADPKLVRVVDISSWCILVEEYGSGRAVDGLRTSRWEVKQ